MTRTARAWLPEQALDTASIETAVMSLIKVWAGEWVSTPVTFEIAPPTKSVSDAFAHEMGDEELAVHISNDSMTAIGAACAGLALTTLTMRKDKACCVAVGRSAVGDLVDRLGRSYERSPKDLASMFLVPPRKDKRHRLHFVETGGQWELLIDASEATVIAIRRASAQPASPLPSLNSDALNKALAAQSIDLGAKVGTTRLPIGATRDLAIGDVLLLDRSTTDAMPMAIDGRSISAGSVRLRGLALGVALEIDQPVQAHPSQSQ